MNLRYNIITREERDYYILYNGDNRCIISLGKKMYDELIIQDKKEHEKYHELYNFLLQNDFLKEKYEEKFQSKNTQKDSKAPDVGGFPGLKSNLNPFNVLWALTPLCNLQCIYCLTDTGSHKGVHKTIPTNKLLKIADQLIASKVFMVTLSGGECLLIKDIWKIVKKLRDAGVTVLMISNGTIISDSVIENLRKYKVSIGISIDGPNEKINRLTRGKGVFNKAVGAVKRLKEGGIQPSIPVTLTKYNFPVLFEHLGFLEKLGITSVTLQDLKPFGSREVYDKARLTIQQEITLLKTFKNMLIKRDYFFVYPSELFIFFKKNVNGKIMQCPAGDKSAYIDFHGDLYPCTTLSSFKMGSLLEDVSLSELWQKSDAVLKLREIKDMPIETIPGCRSCANKLRCDGGCRGDALFYTNDLFGLPSRCPKALGFGNLSKKPKTHNENHISLYTKDLRADKAEFILNKASKRF